MIANDREVLFRQLDMFCEAYKIQITTDDFTLLTTPKKYRYTISRLYQNVRDMTSFWTQLTTYVLILLYKTLQQWREYIITSNLKLSYQEY
jgi:hypothetical protein